MVIRPAKNLLTCSRALWFPRDPAQKGRSPGVVRPRRVSASRPRRRSASRFGAAGGTRTSVRGRSCRAANAGGTVAPIGASPGPARRTAPAPHPETRPSAAASTIIARRSCWVRSSACRPAPAGLVLPSRLPNFQRTLRAPGAGNIRGCETVYAEALFDTLPISRATR